jgi:hypothetical protein
MAEPLRVQLHQDAMVDLVMPEPGAPANIIQIQGHVGKSGKEGVWRVYSKDLRTYVDIKAEDIVHAQQPNPDQDPSILTKLWVRMQDMTGPDAFVQGVMHGLNMSGKQMVPVNEIEFFGGAPYNTYYKYLSWAPCCETS